jgi:hypothetical protein
MSQPIFTMLPFSVPNPTLPKISEFDIERFDYYEKGAFDHWLLGASAQSLVGRLNGTALTPQSTVSYGAAFAQIGQATGTGLLSTLDDAAVTNDTVCMVARLSAGVGSNTAMLLGNIGPTEGYALFVGATGFLANSRLTPTLAATTVTAGTLTTYRFIAMSRTQEVNSGEFRVFISGVGSFTVTRAGTYSPSAAKIGLGNVASTAPAAAVTTNIAEAIIYSRALTLSEISDVYARSVDRMAIRGITVA